MLFGDSVARFLHADWEREHQIAPTCHAEVHYTTIGRPPAQSTDLLSCYPSHTRSFLSDIQELTNKGRLHSSDGHSSATRGGVISVIYKTHWRVLSEPSWGWEMDLHHSRNHILRYSVGTPDQHRQTNRFYSKMRFGAAQLVSFLRTRANIFGAQLCSRHAHRVDSPPPRHSTS